ncbi:hypothetical protein C479_02701 [Halovivax asiaticus JCM 14624]|uniref:DUF7322 domain-containing protein n=1 Tax=Halovivax asiaticus JCM 14624 TaxID=1227490 RepID=M0BVM0_9EURY|nr:CPBP family intramembrane metalloprotease [Halovivax asiaticus]ELZ13719.1 hypothetical protein C479_02701 [Halovivax asiaticus JCM 14624]
MGLDDFNFEPSSAEPEEWDPEADLYDPDADGITIPQVSTDPSEVDPEISRAFWTIVLVVNAALLFVSLGPMLWFFLGWAQEGITLIVGGLALFGLAYYRYRRFMANAPDQDDDTDDDGKAPGQSTESNSNTEPSTGEHGTAMASTDETSDERATDETTVSDTPSEQE